jgi:diguanylate cyclase (GGDEF)-like protein
MNSEELLRELRRAVEGLKAFNDVGRSLTSTLDQGQVLAIVMEKVGEILRPASWALLLADERRGDLEIHVATGAGAERLTGQRALPGEGIAGWVAEAGQPVLLEDARTDPRFSERVDPSPPGGPRSYIAAPLREMGRVLGVVALAAHPERPFAPDDLRTVAGLADYAAIALSNARNFERVRELTLIDDHTGLYNARHLHRALEAEVVRARRFGRELSLVFLDLDHFKGVNDAYGHQAGSALLREVGVVMRANLRAIASPCATAATVVAILPETGREQARSPMAAPGHREAVYLEDRRLAVRITGSVGLATSRRRRDGRGPPAQRRPRDVQGEGRRPRSAGRRLTGGAQKIFAQRRRDGAKASASTPQPRDELGPLRTAPCRDTPRRGTRPSAPRSPARPRWTCCTCRRRRARAPPSAAA